MRSFLFITLLTLTFSYAFTQFTLAVCTEGPPDTFTCNTNPPNPDLMGIQEGANNNDLIIDVLPGAGIDTTASGDNGIDTGDGNNRVTVNQAEITALDRDSMDLGDGDDIVEVNDSTLRCEDNCIHTQGGNDRIDVRRSIVASFDNNGIEAQGGDNIVHVIDSDIIGGPDTGNNFGIKFGSGDDMLTVTNSLVFGDRTGGQDVAIVFDAGDDTLRLETGARIEGLIECGPDFDTIIFAMAVPTGAIDSITSAILSKDPAGDSITINKLFYEWVDCEELIPELTGGFISPVPTLSEWGLIAMAGILGIVGFLVMRRRKATA